ncbi:EAL domain-containing protein [Vallitaleaceae bacterium 9-2]
MDNYIARQPIFDRHSHTIAYELLYRHTHVNYFDGTIDDSAATSIVLVNSYLNFGLKLISEHKLCFINFNDDLILQDIPLLLSPDQTVIELLETVKPSSEIIEKLILLKSKGYLIALDDYTFDYPYKDILDLCDIVKVDFFLNPKDKLPALCHYLRKNHKLILAEKVETKEEFNYALELGFDYFQGYYFSHPIMLKKKKINTVYQNYMLILSEMQKDEPNYNTVVSIIETDVSLTYRLLKLVNSSFSLVNDIKSIKHALAILGINNFNKWFTLATINQLSQDQPDELVKISIFRMKFMENLGNASSFYTYVSSLRMIGVLSMLDAILEQPMDVVLNELPILEDIKNTLLLKETKFSDLFQLMIAYEKGDFDAAQDICKKIDLDFTAFPDLYLNAISWADELFDYLNHG